MKRNVVGLLGGLGNQLFQVAFGRWLEQRSGEPTLFDLSYLRTVSPAVTELDGFGASIAPRLLEASRYWPTPDGRLALVGRAVRRTCGPRSIVRDYTSPGPPPDSCNEFGWWLGYFQRAAYTDAIVPELITAFGVAGSTSTAAIGVHVRRTDMLGKSLATPMQWFAAGLEALFNHTGERPVRVWSDDPRWCSKHLELGFPFTIEPPRSAAADLAEMSRCEALVISRSTFSWWAARLATEMGARVVYPSPWWDGFPKDDGVAVPSSWTPVDQSTPSLSLQRR
jgi:hypothetical protein